MYRPEETGLHPSSFIEKGIEMLIYGKSKFIKSPFTSEDELKKGHEHSRNTEGAVTATDKIVSREIYTTKKRK